MDASNDRHETLLYHGSPISVRDAFNRLICLTNLLSLDKSKTFLLLKELRSVFPSDCRLPKTIFTLFRITNNDYRSNVCLKIFKSI